MWCCPVCFGAAHRLHYWSRPERARLHWSAAQACWPNSPRSSIVQNSGDPGPFQHRSRPNASRAEGIGRDHRSVAAACTGQPRSLRRRGIGPGSRLASRFDHHRRRRSPHPWQLSLTSRIRVSTAFSRNRKSRGTVNNSWDSKIHPNPYIGRLLLLLKFSCNQNLYRNSREIWIDRIPSESRRFLVMIRAGPQPRSLFFLSHYLSIESLTLL